VLSSLAVLAWVASASAHDVSAEDAQLIAAQSGPQFLLYCWLGAKHMVTGYDHLLFLLGVVFHLRNVRLIAILVSLFALGHSVTLIAGVLAGLSVNAYLVDAVIGLSVAYMGFANLGGFDILFGGTPDLHVVVLVFGLFHGLGLATKLRGLGLADEGLLTNLVSFNVGVEFGQLAVLAVVVLALRQLQHGPWLLRAGPFVDVSLILAGFSLFAYQLTLFFGAQGAAG
jgi:hypothetical protein